MKWTFVGKNKRKMKRRRNSIQSAPDVTKGMRIGSITCLQESDKLLFCTPQLLHIKGKA